MKPIKFIDAFLATIGQSISLGNKLPKGRSRIPGPRSLPGTKLARLASASALTKRGRAGKL